MAPPTPPTIPLDEDAYERLRAARQDGESYSDVIRRWTVCGPPSLLDLVGALGPDVAEEVAAVIEGKRREEAAREDAATEKELATSEGGEARGEPDQPRDDRVDATPGPALPGPDQSIRLAKKLMGKESALDLQVLFDLPGEPKRTSELKPLLGGKGDHDLTVALERLQDDGLVARRTDARRDPPVHTVRVTPLGIQTVLYVNTIRVIDDARRRVVEA